MTGLAQSFELLELWVAVLLLSMGLVAAAELAQTQQMWILVTGRR